MVSVLEEFYDYCDYPYAANATRADLDPMKIPTDIECIQ